MLRICPTQSLQLCHTAIYVIVVAVHVTKANHNSRKRDFLHQRKYTCSRISACLQPVLPSCRSLPPLRSVEAGSPLALVDTACLAPSCSPCPVSLRHWHTSSRTLHAYQATHDFTCDQHEKNPFLVRRGGRRSHSTKTKTLPFAALKCLELKRDRTQHDRLKHQLVPLMFRSDTIMAALLMKDFGVQCYRRYALRG